MVWRKVMCVVITQIPLSLMAGEVNYSAGMSMMHSTNINHQHIPSDDETSQMIHGGLSVIENTADFNANINASLQATDYTNNMVADQTSGDLNGMVLWSIQPGRFEWYVSDIYTQIAIDSFTSDIPDNRQNANALSTGPNYYIHLNSRSNIELEGRAENYIYENVNTVNDLDNSRIFAASRLSYELNSFLTTTANYEIEYVEYDDNTINNSYDRKDVFLGILYHRNTNSIEANAGYSNINNDVYVDRNVSRYLFAIQNQRNRTTVIRAEYISELSDSSNDIQNLTNTNNTDGTTILGVSDLYVRTTTRINLRKTLTDGSLSIVLHNTKSDYLTINSQDEVEQGILVNSIFHLHGRSNIILDGTYTETTYNQIAPVRIDEDYAYGATYSYMIGRNTNIGLRGEYYERTSTPPDGQLYDDERIILTLEYATR